MKKVLATLLAAMMATVFTAGCTATPVSSSGTAPSESASASQEASSGSETGEKQIKIGIVQLMEHPSLTTIRTSFLEELEALGYTGDNVIIDYQDAQADQATINSITNKFVGDKVDLIVAIATPSAQSAAAATKDIPVLFSAVTDPVAAKLLADPLKPDTNCTGTSDAIPVEQTFELAKKLTPDVKKFGFLYCTSEVSAMSVIAQAKEYCDANAIPYTEATITNTSELQQAAQTLVGQCDAIYVSIDNTIASAMPVLSEVAIKAKKPLYVGADSLVIDGGLATVGIEYTQLGRQTARMADEILKGTPISEIPVEILENFGTIINEDTAAALGITIPDELRASAQFVKDGQLQ